MSIPAGYLNQRVLIKPDADADATFANPGADHKVYKARVADVRERVSESPYGYVASGELVLTIRRDSFTKTLNRETMIFYDGINYLIDDISRRTTRNDNLYDIRAVEYGK